MLLSFHFLLVLGGYGETLPGRQKKVIALEAKYCLHVVLGASKDWPIFLSVALLTVGSVLYAYCNIQHKLLH